MKLNITKLGIFHDGSPKAEDKKEDKSVMTGCVKWVSFNFVSC